MASPCVTRAVMVWNKRFRDASILDAFWGWRRPGAGAAPAGVGQRCGGAYLGSHLVERRAGGFQNGASGFASTHSSRARGEPRNASTRRRAIVLAHRGPVVAIWPDSCVLVCVDTLARKITWQKALWAFSGAHCSQTCRRASLFLLSAAAAIAALSSRASNCCHHQAAAH